MKLKNFNFKFKFEFDDKNDDSYDFNNKNILKKMIQSEYK